MSLNCKNCYNTRLSSFGYVCTLSKRKISKHVQAEIQPNDCPLEHQVTLEEKVNQLQKINSVWLYAVKQMIPHRSISDRTLLALIAELEKGAK